MRALSFSEIASQWIRTFLSRPGMLAWNVGYQKLKILWSLLSFRPSGVLKFNKGKSLQAQWILVLVCLPCSQQHMCLVVTKSDRHVLSLQWQNRTNKHTHWEEQKWEMGPFGAEWNHTRMKQTHRSHTCGRSHRHQEVLWVIHTNKTLYMLTVRKQKIWFTHLRYGLILLIHFWPLTSISA